MISAVNLMSINVGLNIKNAMLQYLRIMKDKLIDMFTTPRIKNKNANNTN